MSTTEQEREVVVPDDLEQIDTMNPEDYCHAICGVCFPSSLHRDDSDDIALCGANAAGWNDLPKCPKCVLLWDKPCPRCGAV